MNLNPDTSLMVKIPQFELQITNSRLVFSRKFLPSHLFYNVKWNILAQQKKLYNCRRLPKYNLDKARIKANLVSLSQ